MKHTISLNNNIEIDGIKINEKIFQNEMIDWAIVDKKLKELGL